jgi:hypothetical protein
MLVFSRGAFQEQTRGNLVSLSGLASGEFGKSDDMKK